MVSNEYRHLNFNNNSIKTAHKLAISVIKNKISNKKC